MAESKSQSAVMANYGRPTLAIERGEGCYLFDTDGRRYLDFCSGIAVTALGHAHPHLVAALREQAGKLWHCSNLYRIPGQERLAKRLTDACFADVAFFCNSGAEAVEAGIKLVRKYHDDTGNPGRWRIITVLGSFHGRTLSEIAAAGNEKHLAGFAPEVPGFDRVAFGNLNELRAAISDETAAILVEPVQGEGGARPMALRYLNELRAICDEFGLLLYFDEVQTGMGRSGKLFAHQWTDVVPDVMALAKGLGGGFPMGALLATEKAAVGMTAGTHGSTFGGNPLACAAGNALLDVVLEPGFLDNVDRAARRLWSKLDALVQRHPAVFDRVRGAGLLLGLVCKVPNATLYPKLIDAGLLTALAGENTLRLLPPLIVEDSQVDAALEILDGVAASLTPEEVA